MSEFAILLDDCVPEFCKSRVLVIGCGNTLFGDDGFGPVVIERLQTGYSVPDDVYVVDVGTSVRDLLCTIALSPVKPPKIVVIDTADTGKKPGEVFIASIEELPEFKVGCFSLHQVPTSNLLKELKVCCQLDVVLIIAQPESIPEEIRPGLSDKVRAAVNRACDYVMRNCL